MKSEHEELSKEARRQMTEETRKQWISGHVSRGKAYESLSQAFRWLVSKRTEASIFNLDPWVEPFAGARRGVITAAEGIGLLLHIIGINRAHPELNLTVSEAQIKHELRSDIRELLLEIDRLHQRKEFFRKAKSDPDAALRLKETDAEQEADGDSFELRHRRRVEQMVEHSCFPGSPYITDQEILLRVNFTGTATSLLNMLVEVVKWNEFEAENHDVLLLIEKSIDRCWDWLRENQREIDGGGVGWGWTGFVTGDGVGKRREEVAGIIPLDADRCMPQTCFTAQVISSLTQLYVLMDSQDLRQPVYRVQPQINQQDVRRLLDQAIDGLVNSNRAKDGWIDITPYMATNSPDCQPIGPRGSSTEPTLLHTAYAVCCLAELAVLTNGGYSLNEPARRALEGGIQVIVRSLSSMGDRADIKREDYSHFLSRSTTGREVVLEDEAGIYTIFKALAVYSTLSDPDNPIPGYEDLQKLTDDTNKPYYALARFILDEIREKMHNKHGFPATGRLGDGNIDKFPAIRATSVAISAFQYFGLKQMVPGISAILDKHLTIAREAIILELVEKYGDLEQRGIRVAWGLIESDGETIQKQQTVREQRAQRSSSVPPNDSEDEVGTAIEEKLTPE